MKTEIVRDENDNTLHVKGIFKKSYSKTLVIIPPQPFYDDRQMELAKQCETACKIVFQDF